MGLTAKRREAVLQHTAEFSRIFGASLTDFISPGGGFDSVRFDHAVLERITDLHLIREEQKKWDNYFLFFPIHSEVVTSYQGIKTTEEILDFRRYHEAYFARLSSYPEEIQTFFEDHIGESRVATIAIVNLLIGGPHNTLQRIAIRFGKEGIHLYETLLAIG